MPYRQRSILFLFTLATILIPLSHSTASAQTTGRQADLDQLRALAVRYAEEAAAARTPLYERLIAIETGPMGAINADPDQALVGIDEWGYPIILGTTNMTSAKTIGTDRLWPGGDTGLGLQGANQRRQLAVWDGGSVRLTHRELAGRITLMDTPTAFNNHATHVAGTMVAQGYTPKAQGMSPVAYLDSYDWTNDGSEMSVAASQGLQLSNHSYRLYCGWQNVNGEWHWYGRIEISETEDPRFGFYGLKAIINDEIAYNAPHYLIVFAASNDRNDTGPPPGTPHWIWNSDLGEWVTSTLTHAPDGGDTGYDTLPPHGCAKNVLTVGAVTDLVNGWSGPHSVFMSAFSSWGPTDDGRIKPDLVANGVGLYSSTARSDYDYSTYSGTSMATPSVTGSLNLLVGHFEDTHGWAPRSATIKAMATHTANEAGSAPGPDYSFGWGLFNSVGYARLISEDATTGDRVIESTHVGNTTSEFYFYSDGLDPITVTASWTDLPDTMPVWSLDPPDLALINDLDLRLEHLGSGTVHLPWILDPANPAAAATRGDNFRDNLEQIDVAAPAAGWYRITVEDDGTMATATQDYSLIQSGLRQVFHVANGGSAAATGTPDDPFASVAQAQSSFLGSGEIVLQPGAYDQTALVVDPHVAIRGETGDPRDVVVTGGGFLFQGTSGGLADMTLRGMSDAAVQCTDGADPLIEGCVLEMNAGAFAGAINCIGSSPTIRSCTLALNEGVAAIVVSGGSVVNIDRTILAFNSGMSVLVYEEGSEAILSCCDIYENGGGDWPPPIDTQVDLRGNFSADPCFCDVGSGDYTLSEDSFALAGRHPWGCDELVGALGAGCPSRQCEDVVAVGVSGFTVDRVAEGMRVSWLARGSDDPDQFRVTRGLDPQGPRLPVSSLGGGRFEAMDRNPHEDGISTLVYALHTMDGNVWTTAASGDIQLPQWRTGLREAVPNPFNPRTTIHFTLAERQNAKVEICDVAGRRVAVLLDQVMAAGEHEVPWFGRDRSGRDLAAGVYFVRLETGERVESLKLMLVR